MRIREIIWPEERIEHIAHHGVTPREVEEVCFGRAFVQRAKSEGKNPLYYVLGQTLAGRYLFCVIIQFPDNKGYPPANDRQREAPISKMAKTMNKSRIPETDSIEELARFWDTHDLTDFEDELEEVHESVFERETTVTIHLQPEEAQAVKEMAESKGVADADLIHEWVRERLQHT